MPRPRPRPRVDFGNVPASANQPFSAFPTDFTRLPTVSSVVPNLCNDMHDCSIATGHTWLRVHLEAYAQWARTHDSLLIVTFDEDDFTTSNQIPTFFAGPMVKPGTYGESVTHYRLHAGEHGRTAGAGQCRQHRPDRRHLELTRRCSSAEAWGASRAGVTAQRPCRTAMLRYMHANKSNGRQSLATNGPLCSSDMTWR
jgi:hypothetical protein